MITIYDIAKVCNLAPSTGSKALNHYKNISEETILKVKKTADELGYLPNISARNLVTKSTKNIGILLEIMSEVGLNHNMLMSILNSFKNTLDIHHYDITFLSKRYENSYLKHFLMRGFDGVLILGDFTVPTVAEVLESDFPVICFDYSGEKAYGVSSNNYECTVELTQHLLDLGHRHIVNILGESNYVTSDRRDAFLNTVKKAGLNGEKMVVSGQYYSAEAMYDQVQAIMRERKDTTAIMFPDDHSAIGGVKGLQDMGYRIPEDISVTGYDGIEISHLIKPKLTTVEQDTLTCGKKLAENLLSLIADKPPKERIAQVPAKLILGESTAAAKNR